MNSGMQASANSFARGNMLPKAGGGFNSLAAGKKVYGMGRSMPTVGPVDPSGYAARDRQAKVKRNAMLQKMQELQRGNPGSPKVQRPFQK